MSFVPPGWRAFAKTKRALLTRRRIRRAAGGVRGYEMSNQTPKVTKTEQEWLEELGPERYAILRKAGTERPFTGKLLDVREDGTYLCGACGYELFKADSKFDSHCGWPSFTHPHEQQNVRLIEDRSHGMIRTEVRCSACDSHLGHVFDDGPGPRGTRYCINSLSLNFRPEQSSR
jgi:peptide-methionine (R)-S-oxide reductase